MIINFLGYSWKWGKLSVPAEVSKWKIPWSHTQAFQTIRWRSASKSKQVYYIKIQGVCLTLFIFVYILKSAIFDQISQNQAYLAENTLKFCILSKNSEKLSKHNDFEI